MNLAIVVLLSAICYLLIEIYRIFKHKVQQDFDYDPSYPLHSKREIIGKNLKIVSLMKEQSKVIEKIDSYENDNNLELSKIAKKIDYPSDFKALVERRFDLRDEIFFENSTLETMIEENASISSGSLSFAQVSKKHSDRSSFYRNQLVRESFDSDYDQWLNEDTD